MKKLIQRLIYIFLCFFGDKKTRHEIYKAMLIHYITKNNISGLCYSLFSVIYENPKWDNKSCWIRYYPELYKHNPYNGNLYWFPVEDKATRISIIEQAIKETA